jgi:hypothetical protein
MAGEAYQGEFLTGRVFALMRGLRFAATIANCNVAAKCNYRACTNLQLGAIVTGSL